MQFEIRIDCIPIEFVIVFVDFRFLVESMKLLFSYDKFENFCQNGLIRGLGLPRCISTNASHRLI